MTDKKLKVEFAPGCFDEFDGTQEELQEMLAMIHQMAEDGTLMENSIQVSNEEFDELVEAQAKKGPRQ